ncbi:MAG: hypothetical protein ABI692_03535 [Terracoccus sp.]
MAPPDRYTGDDFSCDVAIPHAAGLDVVLTNLGHYQDSKHLHVHVHTGPQRGRG